MSNNAFWKPNTIAPGSSIDRDETEVNNTGSGNAGSITGRVLSNLAVSERRNRLPITKQSKFSLKNEILNLYLLILFTNELGETLLYLLEQHPVIILQSPTGTGKSTQLPQFLLEAGWASEGRTIGITQPRR